MALIDDLPASEKRRLLFVSRLRFGIESKIPRQKAVDKIIENALFLLGPEGSFTSREVMDVFRDIGKVSTLRIKEIEDGLRRLADESRNIATHSRENTVSLGLLSMRRQLPMRRAHADLTGL